MGDDTERRRNHGPETLRVSVTLSRKVLSDLDAVAKGKKMSRSAAAAEAITRYVNAEVEGELDRRERLSNRINHTTERLAKMIYEAQMKNEELYQLLIATIPAAKDKDRREIRKIAYQQMEDQRRRRKESSDGQTS